jgi:hypothetical protein
VPVDAELLLEDGLLVMVPVEFPMAEPVQFWDLPAAEGDVVLFVEFDPTAPFAPFAPIAPVVVLSVLLFWFRMVVGFVLSVPLPR